MNIEQLEKRIECMEKTQNMIIDTQLRIIDTQFRIIDTLNKQNDPQPNPVEKHPTHAFKQLSSLFKLPFL